MYIYCYSDILLRWIIMLHKDSFISIVSRIADYLEVIWKFKIDIISTDIFLCETCHFRWREKKSATITVMVYYITFLEYSFVAVVSHITDYLEIACQLKINFISTQLYIHKFHYIVKFIYFCIKFWFSFPWLFVNSF